MTIAFTGGRLVTGDGRILEKATVVVEAERIVEVAEGGGVPAGAQVISFAGATLLPGFIDCHVHLCLDGSPDPIAAVSAESPVLTTLKAARHARRTLMAGVTTVRDMGGRDGIDIGLRQAVAEGLVEGPRMLVSGRLICMTGGHGWPLGREADGADELRRAAREQLKAGADIVKLMATGGVLTPGVAPGSAQLTAEEMRAAVEEAHKAGRRTATHAMGTQGILNALRAGIDSVEHGVFLDEEAAALMAENDTALIPTISALYHIERKGTAAGIPQWAVDKTLAVKPHHLRSLELAREAGVKIAMGTDAGTPFNRHGDNLHEVLLLARYGGLSAAEAIAAATHTAAGVLGLEDRLGTVAPGKLADLVVVGGDPLADLSLLTRPENIRVVMQNGRIVKGDGAADQP